VTPCSFEVRYQRIGVRRQHGPPKRRYPTKLHGVTTQKNLTWILNLTPVIPALS